ncbi:MAG: M13 family peptidase, partial [Gemmatimonadales bacterium]|nr:M13 family peptidase [Gemmatimonadales bacterium]
ELAAALGAAMRTGVNGPVGGDVDQDAKDPEQYAVYFSQAGLGLPDRDYYLGADPKLADVRKKYVTHVERMLTLVGEKDAASRARAIMAFEHALAEAHWPRVDTRDVDKAYNKMAWSALPTVAPGFDWQAWAGGISAHFDTVIVRQPSAITKSAAVFARTPIAVLRDYLMWGTISAAAPYLSPELVQEDFAFYGTVLNGTPEMRPRWKRGVRLVKNALGEEVAKEYVAQYFPPAAKAEADRLVKNLIVAMDGRLQQLTWMAPETKVRARAKLAAFKPKIGYPDTWRDYSALHIRRDDLLGNVFAAREFEFNRSLKKMGHPVDRGEWFMTPMEVNAYANPTMNEVVFPAAILQPPFFDPAADPAVNYGGIGAVIGHEISHHFDDQGRKFDPAGRLAEWWTPADVQRFDSLTARLVAQYDKYEPLPGMHVQGRLTLGENIADVAGLTVAYDAYHHSLAATPAPTIEGFTGDQRFYLGWAQVWRYNEREESRRQGLLTDPHSPPDLRAATVRNVDPWYTAFGVKAGEGLYLAPPERVRIW